MPLVHMDIESIRSGAVIRDLNAALRECEDMIINPDFPDGKHSVTLALDIDQDKDNPESIRIYPKISSKHPRRGMPCFGTVSKEGKGILVETTSYDARQPGMFEFNETMRESH